MTGAWTRERVIEFIGDRDAVFTDRDAQSAPTPDWLPESLLQGTDFSSGQRIALTHPDDRPLVIERWWHAVHHPGVPSEFECRIKLDGTWVMSHTRQVSLLDDPEFGVMVAAVEYGGPAGDCDVEEVIQQGEFEETRWLIHTLDENGVILATEGMVEEIVGRPIADVVGHSVIEHLHPDGFDDAVYAWLEIQNGPPGTTRTARTRILRPDGSTIWVESTTIKRPGADGRGMATSIVHDVTDRRRREAELRTSQQEFQLLADQVPASVFRADADQRITFRNERWRTEIDGDEPVERLSDIVHADDRAGHAGALRSLADGPADASAEYEVRSRSGERVLAISCRSVLDLVNDRRSYVGSVTDITATVRLREQAERDALTGLFNRRAVEERLGAALLADAAGTTVLFVDLDGFKAVNDSWGHDVGDLVLRELAARLVTSMRPDDVVGRFGGDEFVIVARGTDERADTVLVDRLTTALAGPILWDGGSWEPAASIGIAHGRPGEDAEGLVRRADHEMFAEKRRRRPAPAR